MKGLRKPQRECFNVAVECLNVSRPSQLVLIDDRAPNVEAAAECGLSVILFKGADALRGDLLDIGLL